MSLIIFSSNLVAFYKLDIGAQGDVFDKIEVGTSTGVLIPCVPHQGKSIVLHHEYKALISVLCWVIDHIKVFDFLSKAEF